MSLCLLLAIWGASAATGCLWAYKDSRCFYSWRGVYVCLGAILVMGWAALALWTTHVAAIFDDIWIPVKPLNADDPMYYVYVRTFADLMTVAVLVVPCDASAWLTSRCLRWYVGRQIAKQSQSRNE